MSFELFMLGKARKETIVSIGGKIMANLSQQRREQMLSFLETLKEQHNDDASLIAINQIEKELTSKKYGLVWEEHEEEVDVKMKTHIPVCITKISTFLILCDLAVCLATLYVSFSLVFALMRYLQGKVFLIRFYSPTTLSSSRAEFRLPSRLACA